MGEPIDGLHPFTKSSELTTLLQIGVALCWLMSSVLNHTRNISAWDRLVANVKGEGGLYRLEFMGR